VTPAAGAPPSAANVAAGKRNKPAAGRPPAGRSAPAYDLPPAAPGRSALRGPVAPLPAGFPRFNAYIVTYEANLHSATLTRDDFRRSDWGEDALLFVQPPDWPVGFDSASANYKRVLEHAAAVGCDFALLLEDDVRVGAHLRHNLAAITLVARDQCDYLSLYMPDLIREPWARHEPHLGYRLAKPMYSGPSTMWVKHRLWGSQGYLLSRRFILAALTQWDRLKMGLDTRVISVCSELTLPMWYTAPCLIEHAPIRSAHSTPLAHAPDFDRDFRLEVGPGFQPPEEVPGWLTHAEGHLLWQSAAGRDVLELETGSGRATVCLAQRAAGVLTCTAADPAEAREWLRRYGLTDRVTFARPGEVPADRKFGLAFVDGEHDADSVRRDIDAVLPRLAPGGLLAFHDYPDPGWPDVRRVVDEYARRHGWTRSGQADYLGVFRT
jgi:hypothetical protein